MHNMISPMIRRYIAVLVGGGMVLALQGAAPAAPARAQSAPAQTLPPNQLASVVLAKGVKSSDFFGQGELSPVDPTTTFFNTDLPYAIVKVKTLRADTKVSFRVSDPTGPAFALEVKAPPHKDKPWETFDFALPVYILGTDLETRIGTWSLQVLINDQPVNTTKFQLMATSPIQLSKIKSLVDQDPMNADLHWRYGAAFALLHHDQEAIREIQNAIQIDRKYALYYITLGRIYERTGRPADAVKMFQTAVSTRGSTYDTVYSGWAQAHLSRLQAR